MSLKRSSSHVRQMNVQKKPKNFWLLYLYQDVNQIKREYFDFKYKITLNVEQSFSYIESFWHILVKWFSVIHFQSPLTILKLYCFELSFKRHCLKKLDHIREYRRSDIFTRSWQQMTAVMTAGDIAAVVASCVVD